MINVRIIRVPGSVKEIALEQSATVRAALQIAGISVNSRETLTVNGRAATMDTCLSDGARVILSKEAKSA